MLQENTLKKAPRLKKNSNRLPNILSQEFCNALRPVPLIFTFNVSELICSV